MKINRLICLAFIIGSTIFASYYGGNISYALFYIAILLPIVSYLYTVYVYFRFKLYQSIGSFLVVKGDWTGYSFTIANEDYITFRNIKVNFLSDKSTIEDTGQKANYCLLPNESEKLETRIKCNYRGEYYIGAESIEVTDFLCLFTITYPITSKLKAVVSPRVVQIDRLVIAPPQNDVKNPMAFSNSAEEELDTEIRKYYPGDSRKRVHWKASAKMRELVSRKYQHIPKEKILVFMDLIKIKQNEHMVVVAEDKIIESTLAIANYYALQKTSSQIIYEKDGIKRASIASKEEFNAFYNECSRIGFMGKLPVSELIKNSLRFNEESLFCIVVTHFLTKELFNIALQVVSKGNHFSVLLVSDDTSEDMKKLIDTIRLAGAKVYQIMSEDEISDILTKGEAIRA